MEQSKDSKDSRKGKHLTRDDRLKIEAYLESGLRAKDIALFLGRSRRAIERELNRGEGEYRLDCPSLGTPSSSSARAGLKMLERSCSEPNFAFSNSLEALSGAKKRL